MSHALGRPTTQWRGMETLEGFKQRVAHERGLADWLCVASERLEEAQRERSLGHVEKSMMRVVRLSDRGRHWSQLESGPPVPRKWFEGTGGHFGGWAETSESATRLSAPFHRRLRAVCRRASS